VQRPITKGLLPSWSRLQGFRFLQDRFWILFKSTINNFRGSVIIFCRTRCAIVHGSRSACKPIRLIQPATKRITRDGVADLIPVALLASFHPLDHHADRVRQMKIVAIPRS
jgi:hypothetical protein